MQKKPSHLEHQQGRNEEDLYTLTPVASTEHPAPGPLQPKWIRLPKAGKSCPYTGLTRSGMNSLILGVNPPVKSVSLKKRFALRGTRLVSLESLLTFIEAMATSQNKNAEP